MRGGSKAKYGKRAPGKSQDAHTSNHIVTVWWLFVK